MKECKFVIGKSSRVIQGGPYRHRPKTHFGVKMAVEIDLPYDVSVPTRDFSTPDPYLMERGIQSVLKPLALGEPIYAGCMGGIGRTGLFFACLAKALGEENPVRYVRQHYIGHAVETAEQEEYVRLFRVNRLQEILPKYRRAARIMDLLPYSWVKRLTVRLLGL